VAEVRLSAQARDQLDYRGASEEEVTAAVNGAAWISAGRGRLDCRKDFDFDGEWQGKRCSFKQVRPVFIEDSGGVMVMTVYTYFT